MRSIPLMCITLYGGDLMTFVGWLINFMPSRSVYKKVVEE